MTILYPNSGHFLSRWSSGLRGRGREVGARRGTGDKGLGLLGFRFLLLPSKRLLSLFPFLGGGGRNGLVICKRIYMGELHYSFYLGAYKSMYDITPHVHIHYFLLDSLEVEYSELRYLVDDIESVGRLVDHLVSQQTAPHYKRQCEVYYN